MTANLSLANERGIKGEQNLLNQNRNGVPICMKRVQIYRALQASVTLYYE